MLSSSAVVSGALLLVAVLEAARSCAGTAHAYDAPPFAQPPVDQWSRSPLQLQLQQLQQQHQHQQHQQHQSHFTDVLSSSSSASYLPFSSSSSRFTSPWLEGQQRPAYAYAGAGAGAGAGVVREEQEEEGSAPAWAGGNFADAFARSSSSSSSSMLASLDDGASVLRHRTHDHAGRHKYYPHYEELGGTFHNRPWAVSGNAHHLEVHCSYVNNTIWRRVLRADGRGWLDWEQQNVTYFSYRHPYAVAHPDGLVERFTVWQFYKLAGQGQTSRGYKAKEEKWGDWKDFGDKVTTVFVPLALPRPGGSVALFMRGQDGAVWSAARLGDGDQLWSGWKSMGGQISGPPVGAALADGSLHVVALTLDGSVAALSYTLADGWGTWKSVGVNSTCTPAVAVSAADKFVVAACAPSGALAIASYYSTADLWSEWVLQPLRPLSAEPPALVATATGDVWVFARGAANEFVYLRARQAPHSRAAWGHWDDVGPIVAPPSAVVRGGHVVDVFMIKASLALGHLSFVA